MRKTGNKWTNSVVTLGVRSLAVQLLPGHQQAQSCFGVPKFAAHDPVHSLPQGHLLHMQEFVRVGMILMLGQAGGQVQPNHLGAEAGGGDHMGQLFPMLGMQAGFLLQLPLGATQGILARIVQLTGGNFQRHQVHGHPVLPHQVYVFLAVHRHYGGGPLVMHNLPQGGFAVGQGYLHMAYVNQRAVKQGLLAAGNGNFPQIFVHEWSPPK